MIRWVFKTNKAMFKEMIIIKPLLEKRNEKHGEPVKSISIMDELNEFLTTITDSSNNNTK